MPTVGYLLVEQHALVLLSAAYFYGVMLAHQIDKAMVFLDSACLVIGTLSIGVVAWAY